MRHRWIKRAILTFAALILSVTIVLAWILWPSSGSLVGQAARNDISGLKRSLFLGADINGYSMWGWRRENKGATPLSAAVQYGGLETVEFLLSRGADPNQRDGGGMPPICWAAIHDRLDVSTALVKAGAIANLPKLDHQGNPKKTAIDYARDEGYDQLASYLESTL